MCSQHLNVLENRGAQKQVTFQKVRCLFQPGCPDFRKLGACFINTPKGRQCFRKSASGISNIKAQQIGLATHSIIHKTEGVSGLEHGIILTLVERSCDQKVQQKHSCTHGCPALSCEGKGGCQVMSLVSLGWQQCFIKPPPWECATTFHHRAFIKHATPNRALSSSGGKQVM